MIALDSFQKLSGSEILFSAESSPAEGYRGISIDTRNIREGSIFCALRGEHFDGSDFVQDAIAKGAAGALIRKELLGRFRYLVESSPGSGRPCMLIGVPDTLRALQELASIHRRRHSGTVVAVTGTNGKTSTKDMIYLVLSQKLPALKTPGNFNNHIGLPLTLLSLEASHKLAVVEMGANHPGEIGFLCRIAEPNVGVITNIGMGHLEFFGSIDGVVHEKTELLKSLISPGIGIINGDDPHLADARNLLPSIKTFGMKDFNSIKGTISGQSPDGCISFRVGSGQPIQLRVPGMGQFYNALAAYTVGVSLEIPHETIKTALESFEGSGNRGSWILWNGIRIYNDSYNANPDSLEMAFNLLRNIPAGEGSRRFAVLGDMLELGENSISEHRRMGKAAHDNGCDAVYTYGKYAKALAESSSAEGVPDARHFLNKEEIAECLKKKFVPAIYCS